MRKQLCLGIVCILLSRLLIGQEVSFDRKYNLGHCSGAQSIVSLETGYVVADVIFNDISCSLGGYAIINIDTLGNILWEKNYGISKFSYRIGPGSLISTTDNGYMACGSVQDTTYVTSFKSYDEDLVLYKFKNNGDTVWVKRYIDTNTYVAGANCKQTKDGGYIITGSYLSNTNTSLELILLMKTDSIGNIQWQKTFSSGGGINDGYSIDITTDGGFLIGGVYPNGASITGYSSVVIKTDSLGNEKWQSIPISDGSAFIVATSDGGGIVACSYATTSEPLDQLYLLKYSASGSIQWQQKYGLAVLNNYPWSISIVQDSNYVITGNTSIDSNKHIVGFVTKIGSTGAMKWYGTYDIYKDTNDQNYLRDIKPTPDGGYIACGFALPYLAADGNQNTWVIKLDSNGCDTIGHCAVVTGLREISTAETGIKVFPNPSKGVFNFQLAVRNDRAKIEVYNMLGEKVHEQSINNISNQIDLSNEPQGIYLYRVITKEGELIGTGKLIIQ